MPNKSQSKANTSSGETDFVLKHRIAGAGFLLFFGALVLPWLLGPPSDASKLFEEASAISNQASGMIDKTGQQRIEPKYPIPEQEQVYISKITPLDRGTGVQSVDDTGVGAKKVEKKVSASDKLNQSSSNLAEGSSNLAEGSSNPAEGSSKPADGSGKSTAVLNSESSLTTDMTVAAPGSVSPTVAKAASPIATPPKVDVGWVVQVGVYTDKRGAAKVVDDLRDKGFSPSISIVDTNRGKATGTRIWLGPYAQRVEAAKAKSVLTTKTGEAGFIRAYP